MKPNYIDKLKKLTVDKRTYFHDAGAEISLQNLKLMRIISVAATLLVAFFIVFTPYIIDNWAVSPVYICFLVSLAVYSVLVFMAYIKKLSNVHLITLMCLFQNIMLMAFMILIDVIPYPSASCIFTPMFLAICPTIFILPFSIIHSFLVGSAALFIVLTHLYKGPAVASIDTFQALVGVAVGFVLSIIITSIRVSEYRAKADFRNLTQVDSLTQLLNQTTSETTIKAYLNTRDISQDCAMFLIDMDRFRSFNETIGRDASDKILYEAAQIIRRMFPSNAILGRIGGDRFVILDKKIASSDAATWKAYDVQKAIGQIHPVNSAFNVNCSIGIAYTTGSFAAYDTLRRLSEDALYSAKRFEPSHCSLQAASSIRASRKQYMLIVDDMKINREVIALSFQNEFDILEATSGQEALSMLSHYNDQIAVVLLDLFMDDINGYDVLKFIKKRDHLGHIPVIVITSDNASEAKALSEGADDMIRKPLDPDVARLRIQKAIRKK